MTNQAISLKSDTITDFLPLRKLKQRERVLTLLSQATGGLKRLWGTFEQSWAASANVNTRINELREEAFRQAVLVGMC